MTDTFSIEVGKSYVNDSNVITTIVGIVESFGEMEGSFFTDMNGRRYLSNGQEVRFGDTSDASPPNHLVAAYLPQLSFNDTLPASGLLMEDPIPKSGSEQFDEWRWWGDNQFGHTTPAALIARARAEMDKELVPAVIEAKGEWTPSVAEEAADVVLILTRIPGLWEAMEKKMAINRERQWVRHGNGTGSHSS